jgi:glutamate dehydrogenase (NADP+)
VPAGDIGVGGREVGFMTGMMKKLSNNAACVFTGKGLSFGGSLIRPEATGYGLVYFVEDMLARKSLSLDGMRVSVSGSGNVSQYTIEKAMALGAKVITVSDSGGTVIDEAGFTPEKLAMLMDIKNKQYGRVGPALCCGTKSLARAHRHCPALRHPKRTQRRRCARAG